MSSANYFPTDGHLFYFWKGRVALYAILKTLGIGPGDEVILPAFTCVVVPNAVLYLGARPIYADIDPATYTLTAATVEPLISRRTRLILAQNTFGLSTDLDPLMSLAGQHNIHLVEDCAHGLGGLYRGRPNGTVAQAAFFSSQWSKPISTGLGGVAYTRDRAIAMKIKKVAAKMPRPALSQQALLAAQCLARPAANIGPLHYPLVDLYRLLTRKLGLPVGSNSGQEIESVKMPPAYARQMGRLQQRAWQRGLARIEAKVKRCREIAAYYDEFLAATSIEAPYRPAYARHGMLRYTVRVSNRPQLLAKARQMRIRLGDWFGSPLYPVSGDLSRWGYRAGQCPLAERACREVINLPTDRPLSQRQLEVLFV